MWMQQLARRVTSGASQRSPPTWRCRSPNEPTASDIVGAKASEDEAILLRSVFTPLICLLHEHDAATGWP